QVQAPGFSRGVTDKPRSLARRCRSVPWSLGRWEDGGHDTSGPGDRGCQVAWFPVTWEPGDQGTKAPWSLSHWEARTLDSWGPLVAGSPGDSVPRGIETQRPRDQGTLVAGRLGPWIPGDQGTKGSIFPLGR